MSGKWIKYSCLVLGLGILSGCGGGTDSNIQQDAEAASTPQAIESASVQQYDDRLIGLGLDTSGEFIDEFEQKWEYSYQIPCLLANSEDAQQINIELEEMSAGVTAEAEQNMAEGIPPTFGEITWESHWNDSLLSLVVSRSYNFHSEVEYWVYNYDFAAHKALSEAELLARQGIDEDEFFDVLRRTAAADHDKEAELLDQQFGPCYDASEELRAQTISSRNLVWGQVKPYLNDDGSLTAIINRATYAGGGVYRSAIIPDLTPPEQITKSVQCEFVSAELKNGQVTVAFRQTPESDWYMPAEGLEYNTSYPVEGLYGNYTDIAIGIMGQDIAPYIFLIDTLGHVSFCDVYSALHTSAPRFFAAGPLIGIEKAVSFEAESDVGGQMMYVNTEDGQHISLYEHTAEIEAALNNLMKPDSSWRTDDGSFVLNIWEDGLASASWSDENGQLASGNLYYGGMTEEGLQYPFYMWAENNEQIRGVLTLECETYYTAPEGGNQLIVHQYTGSPLPGMNEDGVAELTRIWPE